MVKKRIGYSVIAIIVLLAIFITLMGVFANKSDITAEAFYSAADTTAYCVGSSKNGTTLTELYNSSTKKFDSTAMSDLLGALGVSNVDALKNKTLTCAQMSGTSGTSGKTNGILVKLGGLTWLVTYVSTSTDGDVVATLYCTQNLLTCMYNPSSTATVDGVSYAFNNAYSTSLIRHYLRTSSYTSGNLSTFLDTTFQSSYLVQPSKMSWQTVANQTGYGIAYSSDSYNYSTTSATSDSGAWTSDYIWLPSMHESYWSVASTSSGRLSEADGGLWKLNAEQRGFNRTTLGTLSSTTTTTTEFSWLRTGSPTNSQISCSLNNSGGYGTYYVRNTYGLRPALHLNLSSAAPWEAELSGATVTCANQTYTGSALKPTPTVTLNGTTVASSKYTVSYSNNTNAGTATCTVTGIESAGYIGSKSCTFTIAKKAISASSVTVTAPSAVTYTGSAITTQKPTVKDGSTTLAENTAYTLSFSNNTNAGTATVTITGKGNYNGSRTTTFTINRATVALPTASGKTYSTVAQTIISGYDSAKMTMATNMSYTAPGGSATSITATISPTNAGSYTYTFTPTSNYCWASDCSTGAKTVTATMSQYVVTYLTITAPATQTYKGVALTPAPTVKHGSTTLTANTHYTLGYSDNINAGTATITITAKSSNYTGSKTCNFTIGKAMPKVVIAPVQREGDKVYVGENEGNAERDKSGAKVVNASNESVTVEGEFFYVTPDNIITSGTPVNGVYPENVVKQFLLTFRATDLDNYYDTSVSSDTAHYITCSMDVSVIQLFVTIIEIYPTETEPEVASKEFLYPVNFGASIYTFADSGHVETVVSGYSPVHNPDIIEGTPKDAGISEATPKTITVTYNERGDTNYTVYHVLMDRNGVYPINESTTDLTTAINNNLNTLVFTATRTGRTNSEATAIAFDITEDVFGQFKWDGTANTDTYSMSGIIKGNGSTKLFVFYSRNRYALTFDTMGGAFASGLPNPVQLFYEQSVKDMLGANLSSYLNPTRQGYDPAGWYADYDCSDDKYVDLETDSSVVMGTTNLIYYAKWTPTPLNISLKYNRSTATQGNVFAFTLGITEDDLTNKVYVTSDQNNYTREFNIDTATFALPKPTSTGYTFTGWYDENGKKYTQITRGTSVSVALEARWQVKSFVLTLSANGGKFNADGSARKTLSVTNMQNYPELPIAEDMTRFGYDFERWNTSADGKGEDITSENRVILTSNTTLYAIWTSEEYKLAIDGEAYSKLADVDGLVITIDEEEISAANVINGDVFGGDVVHIGDVVNITVTPRYGYIVGTIMIGSDSKRVTNGKTYTVTTGSPNAEGLIMINLEITEVVYTITYDYDGGSETALWVEGDVIRSYTVEYIDDVILPGYPVDTVTNLPVAVLSRAGYIFLGWTTEQNNYDSIIVKIDKSELIGMGNIRLYAAWSAQPQEVRFHDNFLWTDGNEGLQTVTYDGENGSGDRLVTGMNFLSFGSYKPVHNKSSYEFIGWALTPLGSVVYPANYNEDYTSYTVSGEYTVVDSNNDLYARWHIANVQYLIITADNNNFMYTANGSKSATLVPTPRYKYGESNEITMAFAWYKLGEDGYVEVTDEHGIPISYELTTNDYYNNEEKRAKTYLTLTQVADSGQYKCVVTVSGQDAIAGISSTTGEGEYQVVITKATLKGFSIANESVVYDGEGHSIKFSHGADVYEDYVAYLATERITVNDGISYIDVGTYVVYISFNVPEDANYNAIPALNATLTITPRKISGVTWSSNVDGNLFTREYNAMQLSVYAEILVDVLADQGLVTAVLKNDNAVNVGGYTAELIGLSGEKAGNYTLDDYDGDRADFSQEYEITKATYDVSGIVFEDGEFIYDGLEHSLTVAGVLPAGVMVDYNMEFTPNTVGATSGSIIDNGGINAGVYFIIVTFIGDYDNYEPIESMSATLAIQKTDYTLDLGDFKNTALDYDPSREDNACKPVIAEEKLLGIFGATYVYEQWNELTSTYGPIAHPGKIDGVVDNDSFFDTGSYHVVATFEFVGEDSVLNSNNYNVPEPYEILYSVALPDVNEIVCIYNRDEEHKGRYKVGDVFDRTDLVVTAKYQVEENGVLVTKQKTLSDNEYVLFHNNKYADEAMTQYLPFETFLDVGGEGGVVIVVSYGGVTKNFTVQVDKGEMDLSNIVLNGGVYTYDGLYHLPTASNLPEGVSVYYTLGVDPKEYAEILDANGNLTDGVKNMGEYTFTAHFRMDDIRSANYNDITTTYPVVVTINPKMLNLIFEVTPHDGTYGIIYDGQPYEVTVHADFVEGEERSFTFVDDLTSALHAGTYVTQISAILNGLDEDPNYILPTISSYEWTILQRTVTVEFVHPDYVYNGEEQSVTVLIGNTVGGDVVTATLSFGSGVSFLNADTYTVTVTGLMLDGVNADNYRLPDSGYTDTYVIAPKPVMTAWYVGVNETDDQYGPVKLGFKNVSLFPSVTVKMYYLEGNERVFIKNGMDDVVLTLSSDKGDFINVGSYVLTALCTDTNYQLLDDNMDFEIVASTSTVTWSCGKNADASDALPVVPAEDIVDGEYVYSYNLNYDGVRHYFFASYTALDGSKQSLTVTVANGEIIKNYTENGVLLTASFPTGSVNYVLANPTLTVYVVRREISVNWGTCVYNGSTQTLTGVVTGALASQPVTLSFIDGNTGKNAGDYTVSFSLESESYISNYVLNTDSGYYDENDGCYKYDWRIEPIVVEIQWDNLALTYNGENQIPTYTVTNKVAGDELSFVYTVSEDDIITESYADVDEYKFCIVGIDGNDNYTLVEATNLETLYNVNPATPVVTVVYREYYDNNKSYTGTTLRNDKIEFTASYNGSDVVGTVTFDNVNALAGKTGNVSVGWTFIPSVVKYGGNYDAVNGNLNMTVTALAMQELIIDKSKAKYQYTQGEFVDTTNLDIYRVYNNYYVEDGVMYGNYAKVTDFSELVFKIGSQSITIAELTVPDGETEAEITVSVADKINDGIEGSYTVLVNKKSISSVTYLSGKTEYYEGETFDPSVITLKVTYEDNTTENVTGDKVKLMPDYQRPLTVADTSVVVKYHVETTIPITVHAKQDLDIVYSVGDMLYTGNNIDLPLAKLNGTNLPNMEAVVIGCDGASYTITAEYEILYDKGSGQTSTATINFVGAYTINVNFTLSSDAAIKYNQPDTITRNFNVDVKPQVNIDVTMDSSWFYGDTANHAPTATTSVSGNAVNGITVKFVYSTTETGTYDLTTLPTDAGTYWVKGVVENDGQIGDVVYAAGESVAHSFEIKKAPLTITVADAQVVYDSDELPVYSVKKYEGFVNGENESVLTGTLAFACNYVRASASVGDTFDIVASGYDEVNYAITYVNGTLTVIALAPNQLTLVAGSHYDIDRENKILHNVIGTYGENSGNTADIIKSNFEGTVKVVDADDNELDGSDLVGTGCKVMLEDGSDYATVVLLGDVTGDGIIDGDDLFLLDLHTAEIALIEDPIFFAAADVTGDEVVDGDDLFLLDLHTAEMASAYADLEEASSIKFASAEPAMVFAGVAPLNACVVELDKADNEEYSVEDVEESEEIVIEESANADVEEEAIADLGTEQINGETVADNAVAIIEESAVAIDVIIDRKATVIA